MRGIPAVRTWKVSVLDPETRKTIEVIYLETITRKMCIIIMRTEYPQYWGFPLKIGRPRKNGRAHQN